MSCDLAVPRTRLNVGRPSVCFLSVFLSISLHNCAEWRLIEVFGFRGDGISAGRRRQQRRRDCELFSQGLIPAAVREMNTRGDATLVSPGLHGRRRASSGWVRTLCVLALQIGSTRNVVSGGGARFMCDVSSRQTRPGYSGCVRVCVCVCVCIVASTG